MGWGDMKGMKFRWVRGATGSDGFVFSVAPEMFTVESIGRATPLGCGILFSYAIYCQTRPIYGVRETTTYQQAANKEKNRRIVLSSAPIRRADTRLSWGSGQFNENKGISFGFGTTKRKDPQLDQFVVPGGASSAGPSILALVPLLQRWLFVMVRL
jgi:hypothetical protein